MVDSWLVDLGGQLLCFSLGNDLRTGPRKENRLVTYRLEVMTLGAYGESLDRASIEAGCRCWRATVLLRQSLSG